MSAYGGGCMVYSNGERPVAPRERIFALDVLRGFAMLGVLIAYCMWSLGTAPEENWTPLDRRIALAFNFAGDFKFYTILAFLFGLGFSIQLGRAAADSAAVETYCRRLSALAGIGLVHALLLRNGDILLPYALTGFLMIPFRNRSTGVVLAGALAALLLSPAAQLLWERSGVPLPTRPQLENAPYLVENLTWVRYWFETAALNWPTNLTLFLFGLLAGRKHILSRLAERPSWLLGVGFAGLATGTALFFLSRALAEGNFKAAASLVFMIQCWGISSFYLAMLLLALRTSSGRRLLAPLAAIGRLALTNYLMQAGIIVPLCLLFGWFDRFRPTTSLALALAVFLLVQLPFSTIWLRRFQFGPAEWVWRLLTYGRSPDMRPVPGN